MGLLVECKYCRQYFSAKGMDQHIRRSHSKEWTGADKKTQRTAPALQRMKKSVTAFVPERDVVQLKAAVTVKAKDIRVLQAEREQQARRRLQAEANRATADFIKNATLKALNETPLKSVWQEQAAKLEPIKDELRGKTTHTIHLQSVPAHKVSVRVRKVATATNKKTKQASAQMTGTGARGQVNIPCSCGGENERCFRCFGTGYFEVSQEKAARLEKQRAQAGNIQPERPVSFASDERGGRFSLREHGRFSSAPLSDEYNEDSTS